MDEAVCGCIDAATTPSAGAQLIDPPAMVYRSSSALQKPQPNF